jgi:large subunit ribosomal protein L19e
MVDISNQRRIAASLLKCGINRVWIDTNRTEDVANAVTREDIRNLIKSEIILKKQKKGKSRARAKHTRKQRAKGKRKGSGSRKGKKYARTPRKRRWISTIRAIRSELRELRDTKAIDTRVYRKFYLYAKGGMFKSRAHLRAHLQAENLLKEPASAKTKIK